VLKDKGTRSFEDFAADVKRYIRIIGHGFSQVMDFNCIFSLSRKCKVDSYNMFDLSSSTSHSSSFVLVPSPPVYHAPHIVEARLCMRLS
jgi:hypothetical protein